MLSLTNSLFYRREVIVTSAVLTCEVIKVICALLLMAKDGTLKKVFKEWTLAGSLTASGLPAAIYALQNSLLQISYKNLDSLTFSMLNQTKLFFTAFFTYTQKQSSQQIGDLFLLILAAVLLSVGEGSSNASSSSNPEEILFYGIVSVLVASVLSGLASALCQWVSQIGQMIPVTLNAVGGTLVGLVTSYAGGVRKGFVVVSALLVTAMLQFIFDGKPPSVFCLVALPLVITSILINQKYPRTALKQRSHDPL
ncbi:OLC1v1005418C1 [Oldenlandia corymbosa var. corymbosa]|uniref:OLC1v1005418C1 n=1 Tax=Oldenlandia corymbosa var. corymbosa TaxID=529605 RepID=A0AAV1DHG9_OLDCO|nr:OLC1v1005418C1 [Oldenlandia corymbosa var. corymbosa]